MDYQNGAGSLGRNLVAFMIHYGIIRLLGHICMGIPGNPPTLPPTPGTTQEIHQQFSQADAAPDPCLKFFKGLILILKLLTAEHS